MVGFVGLAMVFVWAWGWDWVWFPRYQLSSETFATHAETATYGRRLCIYSTAHMVFQHLVQDQVSIWRPHIAGDGTERGVAKTTCLRLQDPSVSSGSAHSR